MNKTMEPITVSVSDNNLVLFKICIAPKIVILDL